MDKAQLDYLIKSSNANHDNSYVNQKESLLMTIIKLIPRLIKKLIQMLVRRLILLVIFHKKLYIE